MLFYLICRTAMLDWTLLCTLTHGRSMCRSSIRCSPISCLISSPVEAKVDAFSQWSVPTDKKALRCFFGMAGYYSSFWCNFSSVDHPWTNLLSPKVKFVWSPEYKHTFKSVKSFLFHAPVLAAPDLTLRSLTSITSITLQSKKIALLLALQHFKVYVGSSVLLVIVYIDHNLLVFTHVQS